MKALQKRREILFDITNIYVWIGEHNIDAAERFLVSVEQTFEQIRRNPGIGWERSWRNRKLEGVRSWRIRNFPNYLVFYREQQQTIEIYAVLSGYRHLERALARR